MKLASKAKRCKKTKTNATPFNTMKVLYVDKVPARPKTTLPHSFTETGSSMTTPLILLFLSLLGMLDTAYLSYVHLFGSAACGAGSGCDQVLTSAYASVLGLPLSILGLGFYVAVAVLSWRAITNHHRAGAIRILSVLALLASLPTLFFIYVQAVEIQAYCPFCLLSAGLIFAIVMFSFLDRKHHQDLSPLLGTITLREALPVFVALILPALVFAPLQAGVLRLTLDAKSAPVEIVARIGSRDVSLVEMDAGIRLRLQKVKDEYRTEWLDRQVLEEEAKRKGVDVNALVRQEVYSGIQITPEEIDQRWNEIKTRLKPNTTKAMVEGQIRNELGRRKSAPALKAYVEELRKKFGTVFQPPMSEKILTDPNPNNSPELGSPNAPVTIVAFSDLECSYCARAHGAVEALAKRRPNDVRIVYRHLPLEHMHKHALYAAEVAASVHQQGKFWELADVLFKHQNNLTPTEVRRLAQEAGVDMAQLDAQLEDGKRIVEADIAAGKALGITSTPTFFINGHYVGSLPVGDGLDKLVDRALKTANH